ncbi:MAG: SMC-Scp complex subunit ScpB [Phycisphaera sp.]|nr:SMC-Scp complex subunit ScpB [Phycisphaera sp.]
MSETAKRTESEDPSPAIAPEMLPRYVEAALMTTDRPITAAKLAELLGVAGAKAIHEAIASLNDFYTKSDRSFRVEQLAGGYQVVTLPEFGPALSSMHKTKGQSKLSPAALETLAIIAYKQPVLRADIEAIRGVASGEMVRTLMERRLVKIVGRAEEIGRPMLYGTTKTFLETFGLASLKDLPRVEEFKPTGDKVRKPVADASDDAAVQSPNGVETQAPAQA